MYRLMTMRMMKIALFVAVIAVCLPPSMRADESDEMTTLTFNEPVEIPGQVLSAGTYVFKLADSESDRNIVQIFDKDQTHLYATLLAIPDYRMKTPNKTIIRFEERAAGAPEAIKAWFYPGNNYGQEFVYSKVRAVELAKQNNKPVPSMPAETAANNEALKKAPLKAQQPTGEEVEIAEVFAVVPVPIAQNDPPAQPSSLPSTGSELPLMALVGLVALVVATVLGFASRRMA